MNSIFNKDQIPLGWRASGITAGIKESGKADLALFASDRPAPWAGTFTTNKCAAACVERGRERLESGDSALGLIVNSGNANAATGKQGAADDAQLAVLAAQASASGAGSQPEQFLTASTGVIGVQLPMERIGRAAPSLAEDLSGAKGFASAAKAILTTDTGPKTFTRKMTLSAGEVRLLGVAKGAGMIHPNMATMLGFFFTDVAIDQAALREMWRPIIDETFNAITVDGDTSTNDMALVFANGASGVGLSGAGDKETFRAGLLEAAAELSEAIVRDQEGGARVVCRIEVTGAASTEDAKRAAETLATSLLFKTALHGADPNWGRIAAAVGRSGAEFETDKVSIRLGDHLLFGAGQPRAFDAEQASEYLSTAKTVHLQIDLGLGDGQASYMTANLSEEYVTFNSAYTT